MAEEASVIEQEGVEVATGTVVGDIGSKRSADDDEEDPVPPYERFKISRFPKRNNLSGHCLMGWPLMRTNCSKIIFLKKMDDFLEDLLKDKRKTDLEGILERVQKKNLETMGPMARLWVAFDKATNNPEETAGLPSTEECLKLVEQTMLLVGQTSNLLTFERRKNALSTIYSSNQVTSVLKDKAEILKTWSPNLLGKPFREEIIEAMKAKKESLKALKGENPMASNYHPRQNAARNVNSGGGSSRGGGRSSNKWPFRSGPSPSASNNQWPKRGGGSNNRQQRGKGNYSSTKCTLAQKSSILKTREHGGFDSCSSSSKKSIYGFGKN